MKVRPPQPRRPGAVALAVVVVFVCGASTRVWLAQRTPGLEPVFTEDHGLILAFMVSTLLGALLVWKRPEHPIGWLMAATGLTVGTLPALDGLSSDLRGTVRSAVAPAAVSLWLPEEVPT